jgi:hypothetical protein
MRSIPTGLRGVAAVLALVAPWTAAGCGGGGSGSGDGPTSSLALLIGDAPVDGLSSFSLTLTGLFLIDDGGIESANLLASPRTVDLLDLDTQSCLLEVHPTQPGTYPGARIAFDDTSIVARDDLGAEVVVTATASGAAADFAEPLVVVAGEDARVHFELPLDTTLADDPAHAGQLIWTPALLVSDRSDEDVPLDEFEGVLVGKDAALHQVVVAITDSESDQRHGRITVRIGPATVLLGDDGTPFPSEEAFFVLAHDGDKVEAEGVLASDGLFDADVLQLERRGHEDVARIFGVITAVDTVADTLTLRIRNIAFGHVQVERVLEAMGNPPEIVVSYAGAEIELRDGDGDGDCDGDDDGHGLHDDDDDDGDHDDDGDTGRGSESDLAIGLDVKIDFASFVAEPFPASEIVIEHGSPGFEGTIVDASGLPGAFVVHLDDDDPAVTSGLVASKDTDVLVLLDGSETVTLDVEGEPAISVALLAIGLRVDTLGTLTGPPDTPTIDATSLSVRPGKLRGTVVAADEALGTFVVDIGQVDDPFGGAALPDPVTITFDAAAHVRGDADSIAGFYALFAGLGAGETLEVRVDGLADGTGGALTWRVEAEVEDDD